MTAFARSRRRRTLTTLVGAGASPSLVARWRSPPVLGVGAATSPIDNSTDGAGRRRRRVRS